MSQSFNLWIELLLTYGLARLCPFGRHASAEKSCDPIPGHLSNDYVGVIRRIELSNNTPAYRRR